MFHDDAFHYQSDSQGYHCLIKKKYKLWALFIP